MVRNIWFGDSHFNSCHYVPELFFEMLLEKAVLHQFYQKIYGKIESGARMDQALLDYIFGCAKRFNGEAAVFVVQAGSNNLRCQGDRDLNSDDLLDNYQKLKEFFLTREQHALIVTSVIPDSNPLLKYQYRKVNTALKSMFDYPDHHLHFVDFADRHLKTQEDGTQHDPKLYADALHLNFEGAKLFTRELVNKLPEIANKGFGQKPQTDQQRIRKQAFELNTKGSTASNNLAPKLAKNAAVTEGAVQEAPEKTVARSAAARVRTASCGSPESHIKLRNRAISMIGASRIVTDRSGPGKTTKRRQEGPEHLKKRRRQDRHKNPFEIQDLRERLKGLYRK